MWRFFPLQAVEAALVIDQRVEAGLVSDLPPWHHRLTTCVRDGVQGRTGGANAGAYRAYGGHIRGQPFKPDSSPYRAVIVDEAQDFHPEEWRLIRAIVPTGKNDLFIVGDAHQRIYRRKVVLSHCGINVRGRAFKLRINYRTTEQIRAWAPSIDANRVANGQRNTISLRCVAANHRQSRFVRLPGNEDTRKAA